MEKQRCHSSLCVSVLLSHFHQTSSPLHSPSSLIPPHPPPPHLPCPLNLQNTAVFDPWLNSSDESGHEYAKVTRRLLQSSLETQYRWKATSHSAAWPGSPDSGTEKQAERLIAWTCYWMWFWSPGDLHMIFDPEEGG